MYKTLLILPLLLLTDPRVCAAGNPDSLRTLLQTAQHDSVRADILSELCWEMKFSEPDSAITYGEQALQLSIQCGYEKGIARAANNLGALQWLQGNYPMAEECFKQSITIKKELRDSSGIADGYSNLGLVYFEQGDYPRALESMLLALKIETETEDSSAAAYSFTNIGMVYEEQDDHEHAAEYFRKSYTILEALDDRSGLAYVYNNLGMLYDEQGEYNLALDFYTRSVKILEEQRNTGAMAINYDNTGTVYQNLGKYAIAFAYYTKSLELNRELENRNGIANNLLNIGNAHFAQGDQGKAMENWKQSLVTSGEIGYLAGIRNATGKLADSYRELSDFRNALGYFKKYATVTDSLFNDEKSWEFGRLEANYEMERNRAEERKLAEQALHLEAGKTARRHNLQYSGILILLVFLFVSVFITGRFKLPTRLAEGVVFFAFLLFFEFMLVLLDPMIEQYSAGAPAVKLGSNALLAGLIFPVHAFFERRLKL